MVKSSQRSRPKLKTFKSFLAPLPGPDAHGVSVRRATLALCLPMLSLASLVYSWLSSVRRAPNFESSPWHSLDCPVMRKDKRMLERYIPVGSSIVATRTIFLEAHLVGR